MSLALTPAIRDLLEAWLTHLRGVRGRAPATLEAYRRDVTGFLAFQAAHQGGAPGPAALRAVSARDIRAWMAAERGPRRVRPLARAGALVGEILLRLVGRARRLRRHHVLSTRAPRHQRRLPRPLTETGAKRHAVSGVADQDARDWVAARDLAVVTLLYGCGLRISEALSLKADLLPMPEALRIRGKGGKERDVPVLPAAQRCRRPLRRALPP
jgi:integrase/recombinase XerC